jgi:prepilin-type N-terminal cleavage/methylation domain-containing protein
MKRKDGFSAIELLVTMIILGIAAAIAIPGFSRWLPNYRLGVAARDVFSNFQHARLTAVKRYRLIAITFNQSVGGTTYDYVIFVDQDSDLEFDDPGDQVLTKVLFSAQYKGVAFDTAKGGGDGIDFPANADVPPRPSIGFLTNGFSVDNAGDPVSGSVYLVNPNGREREVAVSAAGNVTITE